MKVKNVNFRKKKYSVTFEESDEEFIVSEELILEYRLTRGKILEDASFKAFKDSVHQDKHRQKLLYYATYKPRTIKEAKTYLNKYDVPEVSKNKYIDQLLKTHVLNDELYTRNYIEEYSQFRMIGPNKIKFDLIKKGISKKIINQYLPSYTHKLIQENIKKLILKKLKSIKNKSMKKVIISLKTYIINKGFDYSDVQQEIEKLKSIITSSINEDEALQRDFEKYLHKYERSTKPQSFKNYVVPKLMQKGYAYQNILKLLEGEER
ncbi:MAG: RecX family transcriptional regulator [Tenericutes bacterium]|jgi:regulatory protein|nr:RecX family transcriptional regulator [Mycoplasmatota bacterium]